MNHPMNRLILASAALLVTATGAFADRIDQRQFNEHRRIEEGRRTGALTWREAAELRHEQMRISRMIRVARADGYVSPREAREIEFAQDAASRNIFAEKHDRDTRGHRRWWQYR